MKNLKIVSISLAVVLIIATVVLSILGNKERTGYIEILAKIDEDLEQSSWTDTNAGWVNGVNEKEKVVLFANNIKNKMIFDRAKFLQSGDKIVEVSSIADWGDLGVYLKTDESLEYFQHPNKIYVLDNDKKVLNDKKDENIYQVRIRYYSKVFRNNDIYGVYPKTDNLPEHIKLVKWDEPGSPFAYFSSAKELSVGDKIDNIGYTLKIKANIFIIISALVLIFLSPIYLTVLIYPLKSLLNIIKQSYLYNNNLERAYIKISKADLFFIVIVIVTAVSLLIFQFWLGFPGYIQNADIYSVMGDGARSSFQHGHPVIIARTLNVLYFFFGKHTFYMFLINLICWYGGLSLIILSLYLKTKKKIVYVLFILAFIANIFFQNFNQFKDINFGMYIWFTYSLIFFQVLVSIKRKWISIILKSLTCISLLFGLLWRHNAIVTVCPIFILFTFLLLKGSVFKNTFHYLRTFSLFILLFAFLLVAIVKVHPYIFIKNYKPSAFPTSLLLHQITACAAKSNDDSFIDKNWYEEGRDFEYLKEIYNKYPLNADFMSTFWREDRVFKLGDIDGVKKVWIKYILKYPNYYIEHMLHFTKSHWFNYAWIHDSNGIQNIMVFNEWGRLIIELFPENERKIVLTDKKLSIYNFLFKHKHKLYLNHIVGVSVSLLVFILSGLIWIFSKKLRSTLLLFSFSTAFSSFATAVIVALFTPVVSSRYMYPVLPIAIISLIAFLTFLFLKINTKTKEID